jgi:hypothetical protein
VNGGIDDPSRPENVVGDQVAAAPDSGRRGLQRLRITLLVDVEEDDVEVARRRLERGDRVADLDLHAVGELHSLQIAARLFRLLGAAVGVEDLPVAADGPGEERRRVPDGAAELEDPGGADRARQDLQQRADRRAHDRNVVLGGVRLHLGEHGAALRNQIQDVALDFGSHQGRHATILHSASPAGGRL